MHRTTSPLRTRSRVKQTDKKASPLSTSSAPPPSAAMPGSGKLEITEIEAMITACLTKDDLVDKLVSKLTEKLRDAVVTALSDSLKEAREQISGLERKVSSLETKVGELEMKTSQRSDDLEQYTRRNNIRVFGIPETDGEDTDEMVVRLFREKLKVDIPVESVDRSHRVGPKPKPSKDGPPRWRPIIVRFVSYRDRRQVFNAKKALKGTKITIREDLTAQRVAVYSAVAKKFGMRNTWTLDGRVFWMKDGKKGVATCLTDIPN